LILWIFFYDYSNGHIRRILTPGKSSKLAEIYIQVQGHKESPEEVLEEAVDTATWGELT
jgi:hypothetical protein